MDERPEPSLTKKGGLGITKNNRGLTLTSIDAKIYKTLLLSHIQLEVENILRKN